MKKSLIGFNFVAMLGFAGCADKFSTYAKRYQAKNLKFTNFY